MAWTQDYDNEFIASEDDILDEEPAVTRRPKRKVRKILERDVAAPAEAGWVHWRRVGVRSGWCAWLCACINAGICECVHECVHACLPDPSLVVTRRRPVTWHSGTTTFNPPIRPPFINPIIYSAFASGRLPLCARAHAMRMWCVCLCVRACCLFVWAVVAIARAAWSARQPHDVPAWSPTQTRIRLQHRGFVLKFWACNFCVCVFVRLTLCLLVPVQNMSRHFLF